MRARRLIPPIVVALLAACAADESPIALRTSGGDAWTFQKLVEGSVRPDTCDTVAITSPMGTVVTRPTGQHLLARVPLAAGDNEVTATCWSHGTQYGSPARQHWTVPLRDIPKARIRARAVAGSLHLDGGASQLAPARAAAITSYDWRARDGNPGPLAGLPAQGKEISLPPPERDGDYHVTLRITDERGRTDESTTAFRVRSGAIDLVEEHEHPAWVDSAVIYGVVPFFFGSKGLADVTTRLDELAALGVTVLWFSPITRSATDDFGYAVTDHFLLRRAFGEESDFRALIAAAHARGMRVILDFVPNHLSIQHRYFDDVQIRGETSPYIDFLARAADGGPAHYFDWQHLKNLDYDHPEVQRLMIEAFAHWVREFDVDGFRVDVAWGPRDRAPEFWPHWRAELKRIKPDLLLLAEASGRDSYYFSHGFDAAYDWTDKLGEWAWREAFEDRAHTASKLRQAIDASLAPDRLIFRFLNNNDTGARFITRHGVARTKVATALLLTLPGLPGLYTGDEVGAAFEPYDEGPPLIWNDRYGLFDWHARLIALRRRYPALYSNDLRWLDVTPNDQVLAYVRPGPHPTDDIVVLLNFSETPLRIAVPRDIHVSDATDLLTGERQTLDARRQNALPGYGVRVLRLSR